jgi:hypothetical protein
VKEREFQGETVYEIAIEDGDGDAASPMGIAVAENHLLFANDVKLVERVLRGTNGQESLAESAAFQRIARRFPERPVSISYNRADTTVQSLLAFLKSPASFQLLGPDAASIAAKLPSVDALKKYSSASGSYMQVDERGLKITSFSLKKEAD